MSAAETPMREELAQLRADIDSLIGTVRRLANGAAGSVVQGAKRTAAEAGDRVEDAFDGAVDKGERALKSAEAAIKANPCLSLTIAIAAATGIGLLVGKLLSRR